MEDFQPWGFPSLLVHLFQEDPGVSLVHNLADCSVCRNEFVLTLNTIQSGLLCVQLANPDAVEGLVLVNIDTNARGWLDWAAQKVCLLIFAVSFMIVVFSIDDFFLICSRCSSAQWPPPSQSRFCVTSSVRCDCFPSLVFSSCYPKNDTFLRLELERFEHKCCRLLQEEMSSNTDVVQFHRDRINKASNLVNIELFWKSYNRWRLFIRNSIIIILL